MSQSMFPVSKDSSSHGASDVKWFAGLAMQAIIAKVNSVPDSDSLREEISLWAWRMAQEMVATEKRIHAEGG
ncbi:MAG: hypothetical protein ACI9G1_002006 [Pirellulaceae bacterium]|jgi:hypothetical protein